VNLALAGLLALIVGASVNAVQPATLIASAVGGVVGNRADVGFGLVCKGLIDTLARGESADIQVVLRKALWLSYLRALISISSACKAELIGEFPQQYRGQPVYSAAVKADIRWLDGHLAQLDQQVRAAKKRGGDLPDISLQSLENLLLPENVAQAEQVAAQALMAFAVEKGAIALYIQRLNEPEVGLLDRTFAFFAEQLHQNAALHTFFETQLLMQIRSSLAEQSVTLQEIGSNLKEVSEISQEMPRRFEQVLHKLESLEAVQPTLDKRPDLILGLVKDVKSLLLGMQRGSVEPTEIVSRVVNEANPFGPLGGRIDSPDQFFGREQTLRWIFETLNSGSSVALIGDRETGKSSLLKAVEAKAKESLIVYREPIYLDLRHIRNESDFYYALCDLAGIAQYEAGYLLNRALKPKRLLLLLDELEKMTWDGFTNQVRGQLRGLAEGKEAPLRLVVAASKSLDRLFPDSAEGNRVSPLSGICLEETVKAWDEAIIRAFIADRLQTTSVRFSEAEILNIIQASEGKPRKVVNLCCQRYAMLQGQLQ
jgi:hypothetical protein